MRSGYDLSQFLRVFLRTLVSLFLVNIAKMMIFVIQMQSCTKGITYAHIKH